MNKEFEKILDMLKDTAKIEIQLHCGRCNGKTLALGYTKGISDAIEIVKHEAEQYEECYNDCGECEAYNKEKHHCPKFCNVIKETVKEIEENHNGWIPCSVRIPTEQERWLAHDLTDAEPREFIVMVKGAYEPTTGYYHSGYGCWVKDLTSEYDDKNTGYGNEIVAWRFFPQPYQPNGE